MKWTTSMAYSLLSYLILLLVIILADIIWNRALIVKEIELMAGVFIGMVSLLTISGILVFRSRLNEDQ